MGLIFSRTSSETYRPIALPCRMGCEVVVLRAGETADVAVSAHGAQNGALGQDPGPVLEHVALDLDVADLQRLIG
jgi:hypothetical protein